MEYVSRCDVVIDGEKEDNFKNFKRNEVEDSVEVKLMRKTGSADVTPRHSFSIDYVIPAGPKRNFKAIKNSTIMVVMDDGSPLEFYGVRCRKRGEYTVDGEKETVQTITFGAERASDDE